jgi:hypothetical protein
MGVKLWFRKKTGGDGDGDSDDENEADEGGDSGDVDAEVRCVTVPTSPS